MAEETQLTTEVNLTSTTPKIDLQGRERLSVFGPKGSIYDGQTTLVDPQKLSAIEGKDNNARLLTYSPDDVFEFSKPQTDGEGYEYTKVSGQELKKSEYAQVFVNANTVFQAHHKDGNAVLDKNGKEFFNVYTHSKGDFNGYTFSVPASRVHEGKEYDGDHKTMRLSFPVKYETVKLSNKEGNTLTVPLKDLLDDFSKGKTIAKAEHEAKNEKKNSNPLNAEVSSGEIPSKEKKASPKR